MPIEERKEYTIDQIKYYLARTKREDKKLKWEVLLKEAKGEKNRKVTLKTTNRLLDNFKAKTITTETKTLKEIKMSPRKLEDKLLTKSMKKGANKKRIKAQMNKTKGMMEYDVIIWAEQDGQSTIVAKWTDNNKTVKQMIEELEKQNITEGAQIDGTTYNQRIKGNLKITEPWQGGEGQYTITSIIVKSKMIKG